MPPAVTTPSPRWPTWSMTRCSVSATTRTEEEFDVAVTAGDRGWENLDVGAALRGRERRDVVADLLMHHCVADDATLGMLSCRLELWFDQRQQMHGRRRQRERHRQ